MASPMTASAAATQQLAAERLLNAGLRITSTATPALNGTYSCVGAALAAMQAEMDSLTRNSGVFVDGTTSLNWPDVNDASHTFNVAEFGNLINAINAFVVGCFQYGAGITTTAPSSAATIA